MLCKSNQEEEAKQKSSEECLSNYQCLLGPLELPVGFLQLHLAADVPSSETIYWSLWENLSVAKHTVIPNVPNMVSHHQLTVLPQPTLPSPHSLATQSWQLRRKKPPWQAIDRFDIGHAIGLLCFLGLSLGVSQATPSPRNHFDLPASQSPSTSNMVSTSIQAFAVHLIGRHLRTASTLGCSILKDWSDT